MSLNSVQRENTKMEFAQNIRLAGIEKVQIASELGISMVKLDRILKLDQSSLNDPWILRNYLINKIQEVGEEPVPFTALVGDWHDYWFLDSDIIDQGKITR
ncbi:DUF2316 family protein [Weissella muntiaci]|uniref:DUF2316 family protein n=1 Tax=Weissella muntiaci TaxID=2508881 RepID=A0A6C2C468_9LACO|nr:DUF2316 family protein [Weissella muntiaci]TYC48346.1 DUF2316 family protein [Weissella muntiaci]